MHKIISWDIGTDNLSYCLFELNEEIDQIPIIKEWKVIDVLADIRPPTFKCMHSFGDKNCTNNANFIVESAQSPAKYFCGIHIKKITEPYNKIETAYKCNIIQKNGAKCMKPPLYKNNDGYYCGMHSKKQNNISRHITLENITFLERSIILRNKLHDLNIIDGINVVVIENQPVHKNPIMKSIQMLVYGYYLYNGINNIELMDASSKLKVYNGTPITLDIKDTHARNKAIGKKHCELILTQFYDPQFIEYFKSHTKRDDLADSFLQGLYYIKTNYKINSLNFIQNNKTMNDTNPTNDTNPMNEIEDKH